MTNNTSTKLSNKEKAVITYELLKKKKEVKDEYKDYIFSKVNKKYLNKWKAV